MVDVAPRAADIYEYDEWAAFDFGFRKGKRPALYRVYSSYAEMLGHVVAFRFPDGTVIEAQE